MNFKGLLDGYNEYRHLAEAQKTGAVSVAGIDESAAAQLIYQLSQNGRAMVVAYSAKEARAIYSDLKFFDPDAVYLPPKEYVFYNTDAAAREDEHERLGVLDMLYEKKRVTVVTSPEALRSYTLSREKYEKYSFFLAPGDEVDLEELSKKLVEMGYVREDMVEGVGQFSVRGGIVDIYSPNCQNPVRIEFFDTEVDSVRTFDAMSQRTLENTDGARIIPCREIIMDDAERKTLIKKLQGEIKRLKEKGAEYEKTVGELKADCELIAQNEALGAIDRYAALIYGRVPTAAEYLKNGDLVFLIEPKRLAERFKTLEREEGEQLAWAAESGIPLPGGEYYCGYEELRAHFSACRPIGLNPLVHSEDGYSFSARIDFNSHTTVSFHGKVEYLYEDLKKWSEKKYTVVILAANRSRGENLAGSISDAGIECRYLHDGGEFPEGRVSVLKGDLKKGFEYPDLKLVVISDREIFAEKESRRRRKTENTKRIKAYTDINPGDYVVHQSHGIGQYMGLEKMHINGVTKDYLKLRYHGTDVLYVPAEQMDSLYKYIGSTDRAVKVSSLGGSDWAKTKARVKKSTDDMAKQLVALYAQRQSMKGYAFGKDTPWQRDFEDKFLYTETDDQLRSIEEVKEDMEKPRPMDRLLCGDVGYGKTEVALRAAFKAVTDSKQVAYLCPTTILAMQHYDTFCQRMSDFPIRVEMLSRFRTPKQQAEILKKLKSGEIDIIIGTHRLIQKDVVFHDLGLLIIDEEQRFGVSDKERLKELKKDIDVLSMTATPIPRTLHMSMINVRDMSILEEPPGNRYPVKTYVMEHDDAVICDAIRRELSRGGQVFYLYNRVRGIYRIAEHLKNVIPEARVVVGHGKMKEDELEDIMYDMVEGRCDVLVCTTIIETGLDIPNANTIIIENADRMGLSQLYQLRGRVGRSNKSAYAYLTYRRDESLSEVAEKRLRAISEFTEFGSGFKIAMRDLEIRGAGNLLGAEQHGHMDAVGYDMYCKILKESVDTLSGKTVKEREPATIDVQLDAYIPEKYIKNVNHRIDIYKRIAALESEEDKAEMLDELIDRFGEPSKAVINLMDIAVIKAWATELGFSEVSAREGSVRIKPADGFDDAEVIMALTKKLPREIGISPSASKPIITYRPMQKGKITDNIKFLLHCIFSLKNDKK